MTDEERQLVADFSRLYYSKGQLQLRIGEGHDEVTVQMDMHYCGYHLQKNPMDMWVYHEIIFECRPDLIIEFGTAAGASALYHAHQLDLLGEGAVVTVDIDNRLALVPGHPRITYVVGDAVDQRVVSIIRKRAEQASRIMVILDDDHSAEHVKRELDLYNDIVSTGQYLVVEDTNVDWPLEFGTGPGWAVQQFLRENQNFTVDRTREKFLMTWFPGGYLRRK